MDRKYKLILSVILIAFFLSFTGKAQASFLGDVVENVKEFFTGDKDEIIADQSIALAPGGDVDKDGQIDAGDIIRFTYNIKNGTDKDYTFTTLKTNIDRKKLNFFHNIKGAASFDDDGKTITLPNFSLDASQATVISFDARTSYFTDKDETIATEFEIIDKNKTSLIKLDEKKVNIKKMAKEKLPKLIKNDTEDN